jgi:hypothetical protein
MRTLTLKEFVLEEFNRRLEAKGRDVRIVAERARPRAVEDDNVVSFNSPKGEGLQC